jgi:superfamily I DNA/RNA helicase
MERMLAASQERHCSVFAAMKHTDVQEALPARARESMRSFLDFVEITSQLLQAEETLSLSHWADQFLDATGYLADLRKSEKNQDTADNRVRNLKELVASLDQAVGEAGGGALSRLEAFLEDITLDREREEDREKTGDAVTLITMHSCKGLEFPHVWVVGLEDGLLPHSRSKEEGTLDEERRLFYVAITRAMKTLTLSHCTGRKRYGQLMPAHPSPFLKELPEELVEHADQKGKAPVAPESGADRFAMLRAALEG